MGDNYSKIEAAMAKIEREGNHPYETWKNWPIFSSCARMRRSWHSPFKIKDFMKPVRKVTNKYPFSVTICRIGSFWWGSKILNVENTPESFVTALRQALPSWNNTRALIGRLYWARSAPENRNRSVIGPKPESNVVRCSAAVCGGGAQGVATTKTAARRLGSSCLAACISPSVYNAHDMIIRQKVPRENQWKKTSSSGVSK